jgi:two-component system sensor histidine kinase KdpD
VAGRHKIFLGMAAGVGKTYRMLSEGHAEAAAGRDVAVGFVVTHGREETQAMTDGLELLPPRQVSYRGTSLQEMDLPGILSRAPELCLIDELAHTNAAGLEHAKRFEDVMDVLNAGIDVYSTVNVQHLESLNDHVAELTGVRVRETLPDEVLAAAAEVVLIDLTPETLIERLRDGKVYPGRKVQEALSGFFKVENLQSLREVSLRQVADDVEAKRLVGDPIDAREERLFGTRVTPIAERLLALVDLHANAEPVIRRAWRSAQKLGAELDILVVRDPDAENSPTSRELLERLRRLASTLGSRLFVEEGDRPAAIAARVARERGTTYILVGRPEPRRGLGRLQEPLAMQLVKELPDVDIRIVADRPSDDAR